MTIKEIKKQLKEMRNLNRRGIKNDLVSKYKLLFNNLPLLEQKVMSEYYIKGSSYVLCAYKTAYCERQIKRIINRSIEQLQKFL